MRQSDRTSTTLSQIVAADLLASNLTSGLSVIEVRAGDQTCTDRKVITDQLREGRSISLLIWGDVYEDESIHHVRTFLRIVGRNDRHDVEIRVSGHPFVGRVSGSTVAFSRRPLPLQDLERTRKLLRSGLVIAAEPAPSENSKGTLEQLGDSIAYNLAETNGDWIRLKSENDCCDGWVRLTSGDYATSPLKELMPELSLIQGLVAHFLSLQSHSLTNADAQAIEQPLKHFTKMAEQEPASAMALANQIRGILALRELLAEENQPSQAASQFLGTAERWSPTNADVINLRVISGLRDQTLPLETAENDLRKALSLDFQNMLLMKNLESLIALSSETRQLTNEEREARKREQHALAKTRGLFAKDPRPTLEANLFGGLGFDAFAISKVDTTVNPGASQDIRGRFFYGTNLSYRLWGNPAEDSRQLWLFSKIVFGGRSIELDCEPRLGTIGTNRCNFAGGPMDTEPIGAVGRTVFVLRNSQSVEAFGGFRYEFASIQETSSADARMYLKGELGFINVSDAEQDLATNVFAGLGLGVINGPFRGSYLEGGWGRSDLFVNNINSRFKLDSRFVWDIGKLDRNALSPFIQMSIDSDLRSGSDSIQGYVGLEYRF